MSIFVHRFFYVYTIFVLFKFHTEVETCLLLNAPFLVFRIGEVTSSLLIFTTIKIILLLPNVVNLVRSLQCSEITTILHEILFNYSRRSFSSISTSSWLCNPGLVQNVRASKTELLVGETELLQANTYYAYIRFSDGNEITVSIKYLVLTKTCE